MWTEEWPTEPGWYWFYGRTYKGSWVHELYMVQVWRISNGTAHVANGAFMYEVEGAEGVWCPATLPELPEDDQL